MKKSKIKKEKVQNNFGIPQCKVNVPIVINITSYKHDPRSGG